MLTVARYIVSRLIQAVIVVWIVATIVFIVVRLTPGDAAQQIAGTDASAQDIARVRAQLGLDQSIAKQYVQYIGRVVHGDFRRSLRYQEPAMQLVLNRLPNTLKLVPLALAISIGLGGLIGIGAAAFPGSMLDRFGRLFAVLGQSMPTFWIGLLFILLFAVKLRWFPAAGTGDWHHYVLPAVTLGWFSMAAMMRLTNSTMGGELQSDYVKLLRAKGLSRRSIIFKHALRNASLPLLTLASLQLVAFLSGSVVVEAIFSWPGVGQLMVDSVHARDYTVVQAATFLLATLLVLVNLAVDLAYGYLDPRIRLA
jgi:peptide/nickel transport system permease protein